MRLEELDNVRPTDVKHYDTGTVRDQYTFDRVHIEDIPHDFDQKNVDFVHHGDYVSWQYKNRPRIHINEDGAFVKREDNGEQARNQAYFALSILADQGYVSRWSKK